MKLDQQVKILTRELEELKRGSIHQDKQQQQQQQSVNIDSANSQALATQVATLSSDIVHHRGQISHLSTQLEKIAKTIPKHDSRLDELNLKIEILEVKTTCGIYIWKINEVKRRYQEAKEGKTSSLYSPPFYSSTHGYRLCLRAYLNGDGTGKNTHVSLFVVIMKGEYDDLLQWPFRHRVELTLINQDSPTDTRSSKTQRFIPNQESNSFKKPQDAFNVASGFPEFVPVSILDDPGFAKNGIIYFRVKLDPPADPTGPDQAAY